MFLLIRFLLRILPLEGASMGQPLSFGDGENIEGGGKEGLTAVLQPCFVT
jgi:hypothetical protein